MKVLYLVKYANALSESYIRAESEWMSAHGVTVTFCADAHAIDTYYLDPDRWCPDGQVFEAVDEFKPDLIHVHWLTEVVRHERSLTKLNLPVTVRGHSFDVNRDTVEAVNAMPYVQRVWLFPHLAYRFPLKKVRPLRVSYNERFFGVSPVPGARNHVLRVGAGISGKGIEEYLEIAKMCPDFKFSLALTTAYDEQDFIPKILKLKPPNMQIVSGLQHEHVGMLMRSASIYVRGHDPRSHYWGMPVSIAEALACGMMVLTPRGMDGAAEYAGMAGQQYESVYQAAELIKATKHMGESEWRLQSDASMIVAERYTPKSVLPEVLDSWRGMVKGG